MAAPLTTAAAVVGQQRVLYRDALLGTLGHKITAGHMASTATAACSSSSSSTNATTGLLDLSPDLLALVASHCGTSAPTLAQACRGTRRVWRNVKREVQHLVRVLADTQHENRDYIVCDCEDACSARRVHSSAVQRLLTHGVLRTWRDADATRTLLEAGADAHAHEDAALCNAVDAKGDSMYSVVQVLLAHGADANARDNMPLSVAAARGNANTVRLLLQHGAKVHMGWTDSPYYNLFSMFTTHGLFPLAVAAQHGHLAVVRELLAHGAADPPGPAPWENALQQALQCAVGWHRIQVVQLLLHQPRVNVNCYDYNGRTLLDLAVGNMPLACLLLKHGARAYFQESMEWVMRDVVRRGDVQLAERLLASGAAGFSDCHGAHVPGHAQRAFADLLRWHGAQEVRVRRGKLCVYG